MASSAGKLCPQQACALRVVRRINHSEPSVAVAGPQSTSPAIEAPKPRWPSSMSGTPVTPSAAASAASTPDSAARPAWIGFDMASDEKAWRRPAAMVATVASACAVRAASRPRTTDAAAVAPKWPTVAVVCQCW